MYFSFVLSWKAFVNRNQIVDSCGKIQTGASAPGLNVMMEGLL